MVIKLVNLRFGIAEQKKRRAATLFAVARTRPQTLKNTLRSVKLWIAAGRLILEEAGGDSWSRIWRFAYSD